MITYIILGFLFVLVFGVIVLRPDNKKEKEEKKERFDLLTDSNKAREMTDECVKDTNTLETNYLREYISRLLLEKVKMGNYNVFVDEKRVKDTNTLETNYLREYISRLLLENVKMGSYDAFVDEKCVFHRKTNHVASVRVQRELNDAGYETTYDHEKGIMHIYWGRIPKYSSAEVQFKFTSGMKKNTEEPKEDVEEIKD